MRKVYLVFAVVGAVVPWALFAPWLAEYGVAPVRMLADLFGNGASAAFSADVVLSFLFFLVWSYVDARELSVPNWWVVPVAGAVFGLSMALPLYLWMRHPLRHAGATAGAQSPGGEGQAGERVAGR